MYRGQTAKYQRFDEERELLTAPSPRTASPGFAPQRGGPMPMSARGGPGLSPRSAHRFSHASSQVSFADSKFAPSDTGHSFVPAVSGRGALIPAPYDPAYDNRPEPDDALHAPDPPGYRPGIGAISVRGCGNVLTLIIIVLAIVTLFTAYPVISFFESDAFRSLIGENILINGTGQAAVLINMPKLVDPKTPQSALTRTGYDNQQWKLVFSDEFETNNRTFYPGDDPYWEAVNLWYGATDDLEWYDPSQVTTADGYLRIKIERADPIDNHNLTLKSGMLQSWNKLCFAGGVYIEISAQLPGPPDTVGYWPGAWMMGNLGRPGYGASTDGLWPYNYDSCDIGALPNQTTPDGTGPAAAFQLPAPYGRTQFNDDLSWLPGQRLSACTCAGEDHPGPNVGNRLRGRGAPEIDILEAEKCKHEGPDAHGCVSQSAQFAPFSNLYAFDTNSVTIVPNGNITIMNPYRGSAQQQAISALTQVPDAYYGSQPFGGQQYGVFGFEYISDPDPTQAYITWVSQGLQTFTLTGTAVGPDPVTMISQREISGEPMSIVFNLAVSTSFQADLDEATMLFPVEFLIDYVRVYQRQDFAENMVSCDAPGFPTTDYINEHPIAYSNPNLTFWRDAGYSWPKNNLTSACQT